MSFSYEFIADYKTFTRKEEIINVLVRTEKDFVPNLSVWREGGTVKEKMAKYVQPDDSLLLAIDNETNDIIGFFHMKEDYKEKNMEAYLPNLKIETIIILPEYRGRGVGTALYAEVEKINKKKFTKPYIVSATWESNEQQHYLFEKNNYDLVLVTTYPQDDQLQRYYFVKEVASN